MPCLKNEVLLTAFFFTRSLKCMGEVTKLGMDNSLTLPSLANENFNSLGNENDKPIDTYHDEYSRYFV